MQHAARPSPNYNIPSGLYFCAWIDIANNYDVPVMFDAKARAQCSPE
jgi:hypothetical protein